MDLAPGLHLNPGRSRRERGEPTALPAVAGFAPSRRVEKPSRLSRLVLCLSCMLLVSGAEAQNGIFADFATSMGSFTCILDYTNAPMAVANFIGLATGQRAWLDLPAGRVRTNAYYDGLLFHRVIAGFMIQTGSPNGQGTDGPGYAFPDEFTASLRFSGPGVLAMANSGPNSNGSQIFVTVAAATWLNDVHTIFGWLTSGTNVVVAISQVATDTSNRPLTNVVLQNVSIRRVGTAAQAFNIDAQNLPVVSNPGLALSNSANQVALSFTNHPFADNRLYSCTNLIDWSNEMLGIEPASPGTNIFFRGKDVPQSFYRFAQIQYPSATFAPKSVYGRTAALTFSTGSSGTLTLTFDNLGGATYVFPPDPSGTVQYYDWAQEPYRGRLWLELPGYPPLNLQCNFSNGTGGSFSGTGYPYYPLPIGAFAVGGTFSLTGP